MKIRAGYDIAFQCPYAVPMVLMLTTHPSRDGNILSDQLMQFSPRVEARDYFDPYGNICTRLVAPPGLLEVRSEFVVQDSGLPDEVCPAAQQWDVAELPGNVLPFLLASRYCDTEKLSTLAWSLERPCQGRELFGVAVATSQEKGKNVTGQFGYVPLLRRWAYLIRQSAVLHNELAADFEQSGWGYEPGADVAIRIEIVARFDAGRKLHQLIAENVPIARRVGG